MLNYHFEYFKGLTYRWESLKYSRD